MFHLRFVRRSGVLLDDEGTMQRRVTGVSISKVVWHVGSHCVYKVGSATRFGTVTHMFKGTDSMLDEFIIFQLTNKPITHYMGHYCVFSDEGHSTVLVWWTQILWKCKALSLGGQFHMGLPFKSCTSEELVEFSR
jgi:hypothetical protein